MTAPIRPGDVLKIPEADVSLWPRRLGAARGRGRRGATAAGRRLADRQGCAAFLERHGDGRASSARTAERADEATKTAVVGTYLAKTAIQQLDEAQAELERHLVTGPDGRCVERHDLRHRHRVPPPARRRSARRPAGTGPAARRRPPAVRGTARWTVRPRRPAGGRRGLGGPGRPFGAGPAVRPRGTGPPGRLRRLGGGGRLVGRHLGRTSRAAIVVGRHLGRTSRAAIVSVGGRPHAVVRTGRSPEVTLGGRIWHNGLLVSGARPAPSNPGRVANPRAHLPDHPTTPARGLDSRRLRSEHTWP